MQLPTDQSVGQRNYVPGQHLDIALVPRQYLDIALVAGQYKIYCPAMALIRPYKVLHNQLTRLQQGRKCCKSMIFSTLYETRLLQPKISIWDCKNEIRSARGWSIGITCSIYTMADNQCRPMQYILAKDDVIEVNPYAL